MRYRLARWLLGYRPFRLDDADGIYIDCLVFVLRGRYGSQPVLLSRRLYARPATLHQD